MKTVYKREQIQSMLMSSDASLIRGLLRIYANQTMDEQKSASVNRNNGIGFRSCDARILTSLAQQAQRKGSLSIKQLDLLRRKMPVYVGQLTNFANGKI
jgi:hypothetical protein